MFTIVIRSNPELMACTQASLIGAMVQTAQLGLMPGNIAHCYYVPFRNKQRDGSYKKEVQFILGYRGMIELINRSGKAAILATECVYANDHFIYVQGLNPVLEHRPAEEERGELIGVYAIGKNMIVNEKVFVYLTKAEIEKVRAASKAGQSDFSPWKTWYEEMAKKTAIKRIHKLLPLSVDIQKRLAADETIKSEIVPDMTEVKDETNWEGAIDAEIVPAGAVASAATEAKQVKVDVDCGDPARFGEHAEQAKRLFDAIGQCFVKLGKDKFWKIIGDTGNPNVKEILAYAEVVRVTNKLLEAK